MRARASSYLQLSTSPDEKKQLVKQLLAEQVGAENL